MNTQPNNPGQPPVSKIQHSEPRFGTTPPAAQPQQPPVNPTEPLPIAGGGLPGAPSGGSGGLSPRIRTIEKAKRHEEKWTRTPNANGTGAIHVRTFSCKLTEDALAFMDQNINEWLDAHPQYEVKHITSTVGILTGKLKEPALICQVWV